MKKRKTKLIDEVLTEVTRNILSKDPASLPILKNGMIKVGNVKVVRGTNGADIIQCGKKLYTGIQEANAIKAITNRLSRNIRTHEIDAILKLECEYVRIYNDRLFLLHKLKSCKLEADAEIFQHRLLVIEDRMELVIEKIRSLVKL